MFYMLKRIGGILSVYMEKAKDKLFIENTLYFYLCRQNKVCKNIKIFDNLTEIMC